MTYRSDARPADRPSGADPGAEPHPPEGAPEGRSGRWSGRWADRWAERWPSLLRRPTGRAARGWRIGTPAMVLLCGVLFAVSADNSEGTDLRPGRYTDLASLAEAEADEYDELRDRASDLSRDVDRLSGQVDDREVSRYLREVEGLRDPAGLEPRSGSGLRVTLSDAPAEVIESAPPDADINPLVVHQQDIQAVVNALWKGGATAVTIAGQRVITTTGIKCEGNAVTLHGVPYPQPYVIEAVGDPTLMLAAVDGDAYLDGYREDAAKPDIAVGWDLEVEEQVEAPAYDGVLSLAYAEPLT